MARVWPRRQSIERPKSTPRYAVAAVSIYVVTGAKLLAESHDRMGAESRAAAGRSRLQTGEAGRAQREP